MISPDEFQKRITQPPKKERERVRERLVKTYEEALVELQQHVETPNMVMLSSTPAHYSSRNTAAGS